MEQQLLTMALEEGSDAVAVFEVDAGAVGGELEFAATDQGVIARARTTLDEALDHVRPTLSKVVETVRDLGPQEAEITFGLKVGGNSSVIIAKGTADVNFAVRLLWKRSDA